MPNIQEFLEGIEKIIRSGKVNLPVFNPNAMRVQQELIKPDPSMRVIEKMIVRDQALSGEVLKIANSAYYRGLIEVKTIKAAIVRLGMREIGRVVLLAASKTQFRVTDRKLNLLMQKLWQHSAANGIAANWLAKRSGNEALAGHAFFAGLLHDIGKLFLVTVIEQERRKKRLQVTDESIHYVIDVLHTREGFTLMKKWNMPDQYAEVVRDHHEKRVDDENILLVLIRLADKVCYKLGIGLKTERDLELANTTEAKILKLDDPDFSELETMLVNTKVLFS